MCNTRIFTWFPKLTRVLETLPPENVAEFAMAVAEYGTNEEEPTFSSPLLAAVFEGVREDIDNSINARQKNKGGRPRKNPRENGGLEVSENRETPVMENENQFSKTETPVMENENQFSKTETPVMENENHSEEVSKNGNPPYINQTIPSHTIPSHTKEKGKRTRFRPPSLDEIRDYVDSHGLDAVDPEGFHAYYESNGWKVGKNPMKSWTAALHSWQRRDQGKPSSERKEMLDELAAEFESAF